MIGASTSRPCDSNLIRRVHIRRPPNHYASVLRALSYKVIEMKVGDSAGYAWEVFQNLSLSALAEEISQQWFIHKYLNRNRTSMMIDVILFKAKFVDNVMHKWNAMIQPQIFQKSFSAIILKDQEHKSSMIDITKTICIPLIRLWLWNYPRPVGQWSMTLMVTAIYYKPDSRVWKSIRQQIHGTKLTKTRSPNPSSAKVWASL